MLKNLIISNIILVDSADISFDAGLNVLSGETGSGKSAIMEALNHIAGARADTNILRRGAEKGVIEASFCINSISKVSTLLSDAGIDHIEGEDLIIRREISLAGKSRAFINNQLVHLSFLKTIGDLLVEIVGQHANQRLKSFDQHRKIVDLFGKLEGLCNHFEKSWEEENKARHELEELINSEAQRLRDIEVCRMEFEELEGANVQENEEEQLFAEYSRLTNTEELAKLSSEIYDSLSGDHQPILSVLQQLQKSFEQLAKLDPSLQENASDFLSTIVELEEISHSIRNYQSGIEFNPARVEEVNERLTLINRLLRKYGPTVKEVHEYHEKAAEKLSKLENANVEIEDLQNRLKEMESANNTLAKQLTEKRKQAGKQLEKDMNLQIKALNMPKAAFFVEITQQKRSRSGDDRVEFFFAPNVGEKKVSIKECASGGELSRLMLALQALLAGKEKIPTLIFDEIDANIGGETATVVGEKLQQIGQEHQVLCITHFPQVAKCAKHHLQISKKEIDGRTVTQVEFLDKDSRKKELSRMAGHRK
ncbi:MAG: DNA repair protein RecN [Chlamydiae bacterium]|nr:DNA repair protein RecN [Chlamydiota bacterium]